MPRPRITRTPWFIGILVTASFALTLGCGSTDPDASADLGLDGGIVDEGEGVSDTASAPTGAPCADRDDCGGGAQCLDWPGGYCSISPCRAGMTRCPGDGACERVGDRRDCLDVCETGADCRAGYLCGAMESGRSVCLPTELVGPGGPHSSGAECFDVPYGGYVGVDVPNTGAEVSTTALAIVPQGSVRPWGVVFADGSMREMRDLTQTGYRVSRDAAQMTVPQTPEDVDEDVVSVVFATEDAETVCVRATTKDRPGTTVHLNIYVNTLEGVDARSLPGNGQLHDVLDRVQGIFVRAGVEVTFTFDNLPSSVAEEFRIIRNENDAQALATEIPFPAEALSLNVALVESLVFGNSSLLGVSLGIPGPSGLHEHPASAVLVAAGDLQEGRVSAESVAQTMAHEIGHYLGLFHTSESNGLYFDPLSDTPECPVDSPDYAWRSCPDQTNLMWPSAHGGVLLSSDQSWVIRRNPLARSEGPVEDCEAEGDEDGNGHADCSDAACLDHPLCADGVPEDCTDGFDNDLDRLLDCADDDCLDDPNCVPCGDGEARRGGVCVGPTDVESLADAEFSHVHRLGPPGDGGEVPCCRDFDRDGVIDNAFSRYIASLEDGRFDPFDEVNDAFDPFLLAWRETESGPSVWLLNDPIQGDAGFRVSNNWDEFGPPMQFNQLSFGDGQRDFFAHSGRVATGPWPLPFPVGSYIDVADRPDVPIWLERAEIGGQFNPDYGGFWSFERVVWLTLRAQEAAGSWHLSGVLDLNQVVSYFGAAMETCSCFAPEDLPQASVDGGEFRISCADSGAIDFSSCERRTFCEGLQTMCSLTSNVIRGLNLADFDLDGDGVREGMSVGVWMTGRGATLSSTPFED